MIGQSWPEYVFIRLSITGLRLVAPLSIIYLSASWSVGTFLWSPFLGAYALIEAPFFLLVYLPRYYRLQRVRILRLLLTPLFTNEPGCHTPTTYVPRRTRHTFSQVCKLHDPAVHHQLVSSRTRSARPPRERRRLASVGAFFRALN
jgi:hypothetical protein